MDSLPRLNKTVISVTSLTDTEEDKKYWLSKEPWERLDAVEIIRRMVYGEEQCASRLQRVLEVVELSRR